MTRRIKILMDFRPDQHEVRSVDQEFTVHADFSLLGGFLSFTYGRGQVPQEGSSWTSGRKPDGHFGVVEHEHETLT